MGKIEELFKEQLSSNISAGDRELLVKYASKVKDGLIVDFGTGTGFSAFILSLASPSSKVISLDVRENSFRHGNFHEKMGTDDEYIKKLSDIKERYQIKNLEILIDDSLKFEPPGRVDLVNIDSSHEYEHTKKEIDRWKTYVSGHFIFHDYNNLDEVKRAIDESFDKDRLIENKGLSQVVKYDGLLSQF